MIYTSNTGKRNTFRGAYGEKSHRGGMSYSHQFIITLLHRQLREHLLQERRIQQGLQQGLQQRVQEGIQ